MNINLLQSFVAVIDNQGLTKAARQLHLTQPAVTKHIQALEKLFGTRLLDRNSDSKPTPEGELLYKHAKLIIDTLERAQTEIELMADTMQGRLTVGASTIPGQYLMPKVLGMFKTKYPQTDISLNISDTQRVVNKVLDEEILVGAIGAEIRNPKLYLQEFFSDTLVFISSPNTAFSQKKIINVHDIKNIPFIWREKGSGTRKAAEDLLKNKGFNPSDLNIVMELNGTEAIITAVEAGLGISLISKCAVQRALDSRSLITLELKDITLQRKLYLVALKNNLRRKLVTAFLETAKNFE